jgi:hypothetical protein
MIIVTSIIILLYRHSHSLLSNEHRNTLKLTTGSASPDSLIDSIQEGDYLFYGKDKAILEGSICGLLVKYVRPIEEEHRFQSMPVYSNNTDYYQLDKSNVLLSH